MSASCPCTEILFDNESSLNLVDFTSDEIARLIRADTAIFFISCLLIFLGMVGNVQVIYIVVAHKDMHTVCNILVANMAIRDVLFLGVFALVDTISYGCFVFDRTKIPYSPLFVYILMVTLLVTSIILVALAKDRHRSVSQPLRSRSKRSVKKALVSSLFVWLIPLGACLMHPILRTRVDRYLWLIIVITMAVIAYCLPLIAIMFCYVAIVYVVHKGRKDTGESDQLSRWQLRRKMRALRMVAFVVIVFMISWGIWFGFNIHIALVQYRDRMTTITDLILYDVANLLVFAASAMNPFIYAFKNSNFNRYFKHIFCWSYAAQSLQQMSSSKRQDNNQVSTFTMVPTDTNILRHSMIEINDSEEN